jgi:hypothetical protein
LLIDNAISKASNPVVKRLMLSSSDHVGADRLPVSSLPNNNEKHPYERRRTRRDQCGRNS